MNADTFSLKARRTTRIPLRIPIVLAFREDGAEKERSLDAWTLIVNVNGARVECKQLFEQGQELTLRVPHLGKSQKGMVVWRDTNANKNGSYECGIKLEKPENLWGVGFPPSDWNPKASGIDDLLPNRPASAPSTEVDSSSTERPADKTVSAEEQQGTSAQTSPAPAVVPVPPVPAEADVSAEPSSRERNPEPNLEQVRTYQEVDLTEDLSQELPEPAAPKTRNPTLELLARDTTAEPAASVEPGPKLTNSLPEFPISATTGKETCPADIPQEPLLRELPQAPPQPPPTVQALPPSAGGVDTASDRLSNIFHELVESALQQRVHGLVQGLTSRMEVRIAEIETSAVAQVEQKITGMVRSQSELLEGRASEIVSTRQAALEEGVRKYLAEQEEEARSAQQEMMRETFRVMCEEMGQTSSLTRQQLAEQAEEIVSTTRTNLWQNVQQEVPALEQEVFARTKAKAEQAAAACFDEMNRRLPERIQETEQSVNERMDRLMEERLSQFTARLAERSEQLQAESRTRIETQIQEVWKQTSQAFLRHIVGELNQKKQVWLQEVEGNLKELSDQNLARTRRRTTQLMKDLGTSLIERAGEEEAECRRFEASSCEQRDPHRMNDFVGTHAGE